MIMALGYNIYAGTKRNSRYKRLDMYDSSGVKSTCGWDLGLMLN